jgi:MFS family permease
MNNTSARLTPAQVKTGLRQMIHDGLATEAMSCLTEGTFLVALALQLGATNFQVGLLGALPTFTNIFQLAAIWLVQRLKSRRMVTVISLALARAPLFIVGVLPFWLSNDVALNVLSVLMFIHYLFGSVAGASWNSWVKDLVPGDQLGSYFSERTRLTQTLNVVLSLSLAFATNYISGHYPELKPAMFPFLFILGGLAGMISVLALRRAPEPTMIAVTDNFRSMFRSVATDKNFKKLLSFNSFWVFALNLVSPFFSVYMMKTLGLEVPVILCLGVLGQLIGIFFVKLWGKNADRFGNKTVIGVCVPIYILCLLAWTAVGSLTSHAILIPILALIHIFSNIATAGINLSLTNIGLKLSPSGGAIAYLAAKNMFTSVFSASAPLIAGMLADSMNLYKVDWAFNIGGVHITAFHVEGFGFFFLAAAIFAVFSLRLLRRINEDGASKRRVVLRNIGVQINEAFELKRKSA